MFASLGVIDYWIFVGYTVGIILAPGPNSVFVLTTAAKAGVLKGYQAALGVFLGDAILIALSALGVASLIKASPVLFAVIKLAGTIYLCYLGCMILKSVLFSSRPISDDNSLTNDESKKSCSFDRSPFYKALLLSLSNPKAILFIVAFLSQFINLQYTYTGLSFLVLGTTLEFISFIYLSCLIFSGVSLARWFKNRRRLTNLANASVGLLFMGFGVRLAIASIN